eukprot:695718-Prymnesium_polylepis.1
MQQLDDFSPGRRPKLISGLSGSAKAEGANHAPIGWPIGRGTRRKPTLGGPPSKVVTNVRVNYRRRNATLTSP